MISPLSLSLHLLSVVCSVGGLAFTQEGYYKVTRADGSVEGVLCTGDGNRCKADNQCSDNRVEYENNPGCGQCKPGYNEWLLYFPIFFLPSICFYIYLALPLVCLTYTLTPLLLSYFLVVTFADPSPFFVCPSSS